MNKTRTRPANQRPVARSLDREVATARYWVLAAGFAILLAALLAQIGN